MTKTRLAVLDLPEGNAMRAPGEAPGMMALEIAIDEMAERLKMDPVEFRILNDTQVDPEKPERPFSKRQFVECMKIGAERFGWNARKAQPGATREGSLLIGHGVASAFRNSMVMTSGARVKLDNRGVVTVETDMTDIGTGSYTIIAQTAAEMMGLPLHKVEVRLGDFLLPGLRRVRRPVGGELVHRRRLCRLRQAARSGCCKARLQLGGRHFREWRGALRQSFGPACRSGRRWPDGRGQDGVWRPRQEVSAVDLRRAFVEVGVDSLTARCGCVGCWPSARPAASSTRNRPAAR